MITLIMIIIAAVVIGVIITAITSLVAISPLVIAIGLLVTIDILVIRGIIGKVKKKKEN